MSQGQQAVVNITPSVHCTVSVHGRDYQHPYEAAVLTLISWRHQTRVARSKRVKLQRGLQKADTQTYGLCFRMSRTAPRVPSQTEQSHQANVTSASHRYRRIDRSSNSVDATSDHTQNPTLNTAVSNGADVARSAGCG
jgi:hypothetical protein